MGRPINKKFFGNSVYPFQNQNVGGLTGVGGEGVATIALNNTGTLYTTSTTIALAFTAPQVSGGIVPTGNVTTNALGNIASVTLLTTGSGYTSIPTATVVGGTTGTTATFTVALFASTVTQNALAFTSYLLAKDGGTSAVSGGDILKQESSRRYLVRNSQGTGQVKLAATDTLTTGTMNLIATDFGGATYWVTKLTAHKATLISRSGSPLVTLTTDADGISTGATGWTLGSATGTIVTIASV